MILQSIRVYIYLTHDRVNTSGLSAAEGTLCGVRGSAGASAGGRGQRKEDGAGGRSHRGAGSSQSWCPGKRMRMRMMRRRGKRMMMVRGKRRRMGTRHLTQEVCTLGERERGLGDHGRHCLETHHRCHLSHNPRLGPWPRGHAP